MKTAIAAILITTSALFGEETKNQLSPLSGDDIAQILALRAHKEVISFSKPKYVVLRFESPNHKQDVDLGERTQSVTLLTYESERGSAKSLVFWLSCKNRTAHSYFPLDGLKPTFSRTGVVDGIFTIVASDSPDMKTPTYKIQVLTSDEKP